MIKFSQNQIEEIATLLIKMHGNTITKGIVKHSIDHIISEHTINPSIHTLKIIESKVWQQIKKTLRNK